MKIIQVTKQLKEELQQLFRAEDLLSQADWLAYCLDETADNNGVTLIALQDESPAGFISLLYKASYPYFIDIPEIHGMGVLESRRRRGIGQKLLGAIEDHARLKAFQRIGLGVGVTTDYQDAFRLYVRTGYIPDGRGLYQFDLPHHFVKYGDTITINTSTTLWLTKSLS